MDMIISHAIHSYKHYAAQYMSRMMCAFYKAACTHFKLLQYFLLLGTSPQISNKLVLIKLKGAFLPSSSL